MLGSSGEEGAVPGLPQGIRSCERAPWNRGAGLCSPRAIGCGGSRVLQETPCKGPCSAISFQPILHLSYTALQAAPRAPATPWVPILDASCPSLMENHSETFV